MVSALLDVTEDILADDPTDADPILLDEMRPRDRLAVAWEAVSTRNVLIPLNNLLDYLLGFVRFRFIIRSSFMLRIRRNALLFGGKL